MLMSMVMFMVMVTSIPTITVTAVIRLIRAAIIMMKVVVMDIIIPIIALEILIVNNGDNCEDYESHTYISNDITVMRIQNNNSKIIAIYIMI